MTRVALSVGAINLSQGYPDFAAQQSIKDAAKAAIDADHNQYSVTWGLKPLRDAEVGNIRPYLLLLGGAYVNGQFGKPETWREITLCNTALFHSLEQLDRFAASMRQALRKS